MTNPYEPPKSVQELGQGRRDLLERMQKYQFRVFRMGLILGVISVLLLAVLPVGEISSGIVMVLGLLAVLCIFASFGMILPLVVLGFLKGYRESRGE